MYWNLPPCLQEEISIVQEEMPIVNKINAGSIKQNFKREKIHENFNQENAKFWWIKIKIQWREMYCSI